MVLQIVRKGVESISDFDGLQSSLAAQAAFGRPAGSSRLEICNIDSVHRWCSFDHLATLILILLSPVHDPDQLGPGTAIPPKRKHDPDQLGPGTPIPPKEAPAQTLLGMESHCDSL